MSNTSPAYDPAFHNVASVSFVRLFLRALGVSFFSLLSLSMAFYAFIALPQVQDLLFDARPHIWQEVIYWAGFYLIGILFWALPLVFTARLLLLQNFDVIGVDSESRFNFFIFRLPSFYAVFAFAAVLIGIFAAAANLPAPSADYPHKFEETLRGLVENHLTALFFITAAVLVLVIFRDMFIVGYGIAMQSMEKRNPEKYRASLLRYEALSRKHAQKLDGLDLHLKALKPAFLSDETWVAAQRAKVFMWRYMNRLTWVLLFLVAVHFLSYSDTIEEWFTLPTLSSSPQIADFFRDVSDTLWMKRAAFLFVIFGAWLPLAAILSILSNRYQFPFIALLIVVGVGLALFIGDGHDARVLKIPLTEAAKQKPIKFADTVRSWKAASGWDAKGCEALPEGDAKLASCPRPIVVAGEGGGSRAAFLIASVLGALEDESLDRVKSDPSARPFHQQLFAISSVSGSSIGAAFFIGALQKHKAVPLETLKNALRAQRLWFLNVANEKERDPSFLKGDVVTYKDALQAALSNDFISPPLIAYLARDVLTVSRLPYVMDRAGVLETAWEDAFDGVYGAAREGSPLYAPLRTFAPTPEAWTPILFLNATSIETGRRVIISPVSITDPIGDKPALFVDAYDLNEIFCSRKDVSQLRILDRIARVLPAIFSPVAGATCPGGAADKKGSKPYAIDIRLSTAAGLSSRSPFVEPHANIRDNTGQIADSVVDGGYFDNSGSVTALEIVEGLKASDKRLRPYLIQVSSEPDWFKDSKNCGLDGARANKPQIPDEADFKPLGTLGNIFTVNATRISRGYETIVETPAQIKRMNGDLPSETTFYICPQRKEDFFWDQFIGLTTSDKQQGAAKRSRHIHDNTKTSSTKSVALSWWLSPPLQAYLDGQVYSPNNLAGRACVLSLLRDPQPSEQDFCKQ